MKSIDHNSSSSWNHPATLSTLLSASLLAGSVVVLGVASSNLIFAAELPQGFGLLSFCIPGITFAGSLLVLIPSAVLVHLKRREKASQVRSLQEIIELSEAHDEDRICFQNKGKWWIQQSFFSPPPDENRVTWIELLFAIEKEFGIQPGQVRAKCQCAFPSYEGGWDQVGVVRRDPFLSFYTAGRCPTVGDLKRILREETTDSLPLHARASSLRFHHVKPTPSGFLPKVISSVRVREDEELVQQIQEDLNLCMRISSHSLRKKLVMSILSHALAYREIDGHELLIPSFEHETLSHRYVVKRHLLARGVNTVSLFPEEKNIPGFYLCQGTELWPSQPHMLGSILANFGRHGSASHTFKLYGEQIETHLRALGQSGRPLPFVGGHSLGGALATHIALHLSELTQEVYAFCPPTVGMRFASQAPENLHVITNLDDFAFWRVGEYAVGKVVIHMGSERFKHYPIRVWEWLLLVPAIVKFGINLAHAFRSHQDVVPLSEYHLIVPLTSEEIRMENEDRKERPEMYRFFSALHPLAKRFHKDWGGKA